MANPPPKPGGPRPVKKFGPFRIYKGADGKRHIVVGEVDPNDLWVQQGAQDVGGAIITGEQHKDRGLLTYDLDNMPGKKKPGSEGGSTDSENKG